MFTKIKAKQLHEDVKGLVENYGADFFLKKGDPFEITGFFENAKTSGFMVREKIPIPVGVNSINIDISDYEFTKPPFINYSLVSPNPVSDFYINQAANVSIGNIEFSFSEVISQSGYYIDILFGVDSNVFYIKNDENRISVQNRTCDIDGNYYFKKDDLGKVLKVGRHSSWNGSKIFFIFPFLSNIDIGSKGVVSIVQYSSKPIEFVGSGVSVIGRGDLNTTAGRYSVCHATYLSNNEWVLSGDLVH